MNSINKHIIYSAEDIHNYLSGKMNAAEMHAIEKAALDDPFLAEAIEGYDGSPGFNKPEGFENIKNDLAELSGKINTGGSKTGALIKISSWWRAAAAILVLLGGTVLAIYVNNSFKNDPSVTVAKNKATDQPVISTTPDTSKILTGVDSNIKITEPVIEKTKKPFTVTPNGTIETVKSANEELTMDVIPSDVTTIATAPAMEEEAVDFKKELEDKNTLAKAKKAEPAATVSRKYQRNNQTNPTFSGIVTDKNNNPIPYTTIVTSNGFTSTTDENGQFSLTLPRNNSRKIIFRADNYQSKVVDPKTGYQPIILESNRIQNNRNRAPSPGQAQVLYSKSAEPKEGWPKYINFLVDQISYSEYDTGKPVVGETIVSFDLNSNAEPINFTFVKEIDTDVNHAIEEMITNGPDWKLTDKTALPATIKLKLNF